MKNKILYFFLIALVFGIIYLRTPNIIHDGRFWAEEGTVYFNEAYNNPKLEILFSSNLGYYSLFNKLVMYLTILVSDIYWSPIITVFFSLAVLLIVIFILLFSEFTEANNLFVKILIILIIVFIQPNHQIWLNVISVQFYLSVGVAIILISYSQSFVLNIFRNLFLIMASFTGVVSCLLTPFFLAKWYNDRKKINLYEAIIMVTCSLIQLMIVLTVGQREVAVDINLFPFIIFAKQILLNIIGLNFTDKLAHEIYFSFITKGFFNYWLIIILITYFSIFFP